ncbi:helix-turn-helix transcriptional regulator [Alkalicoccus chagannorensis]|uniref:helix-turn-helix transcriptional regulator n=1 Tax=Alkalicoccus chagannorensis TaxID=427072 RepID=UPI00047E935B|nr:helix-turn-helix transcriptional regulator [Alkalicoccus chagannorensis]
MKLEKLRELRLESKLTYKQVAEKIGVSKEHYWMIENGKRRLNYDMAVRIAIVFNKKPDEIFLTTELTRGEREGVS